MQQRTSRDGGERMRDEAVAHGAKLSQYNLIAEYEDMGQAKKAVDALEIAGIEAAHVHLLGETVDKAESQFDHQTIHEADAALTNDVLWTAVLWGGAGVVVGAIVGAITAAIPGWPLNIWYSLMFWILSLGTLGGIVGGMSTLNPGPKADLPYRRVGRGEHVLVGVMAGDAKLVNRAETVLSRGNPIAIQRYDERGRAAG